MESMKLDRDARCPNEVQNRRLAAAPARVSPHRLHEGAAPRRTTLMGRNAAQFLACTGTTNGCCTCAGMANLASVQAPLTECPGFSFNTDDVVAFLRKHDRWRTRGSSRLGRSIACLQKVSLLHGSWKYPHMGRIYYTNPDEGRRGGGAVQGAYLGIQLPDDWQDGSTPGCGCHGRAQSGK